MFARLFAVASLAALAVASPLVVRDQTCTTGTMNCCNSVQDASTVTQLFGLLGVADILAGVTGPVGLGCSPLTIVGIAGNSCSQQTVCCTGNNFNGLVNVGCTPINVAA
ncbi:fungal hydrophobin [Imleria badia]|nr:fungal hydrophobin [Imleria badia]